MRNAALVVGSISFDIVFHVHNTIKDEIIIEDNAAKSISMMLTAKNKQVFYGGTGGNIAYGLGIQGETPLLFSVVGGDFHGDFEEHLENHGVELRVKSFNNEYTATFYAISDAIKDQLGIFQPNTHGDYMGSTPLAETISQEEFDGIKVAIFSPGTGESINNHIEEFRSKAGMDPIVIFDPSQVLSIFFTEDILKETIELSNIFIGNETEVAQLQNILGMSISEILNIGLEYIIETVGKEGCIIHSRDGKQRIPAIQPKQFVEQTGAGDAFRAGLIKGLLRDLPITECCKVGAIMGAKNVEASGGQNYSL